MYRMVSVPMTLIEWPWTVVSAVCELYCGQAYNALSCSVK